MHRFPRLHAALDYAADAHQTQARKGSAIPYLSHLLGVSRLVIEYGGGWGLQAGLYHADLGSLGASSQILRAIAT
jgi:(p)ppGpp synthase/HD superfamily hydrolase